MDLLKLQNTQEIFCSSLLTCISFHIDFSVIKFLNSQISSKNSRSSPQNREQDQNMNRAIGDQTNPKYHFSVWLLKRLINWHGVSVIPYSFKQNTTDWTWIRAKTLKEYYWSGAFANPMTIYILVHTSKS